MKDRLSDFRLPETTSSVLKLRVLPSLHSGIPEYGRLERPLDRKTSTVFDGRSYEPFREVFLNRVVSVKRRYTVVLFQMTPFDDRRPTTGNILDPTSL